MKLFPSHLMNINQKSFLNKIIHISRWKIKSNEQRSGEHCCYLISHLIIWIFTEMVQNDDCFHVKILVYFLFSFAIGSFVGRNNIKSLLYWIGFYNNFESKRKKNILKNWCEISFRSFRYILWKIADLQNNNMSISANMIFYQIRWPPKIVAIRWGIIAW